ncbi:sulfotransferase [Lewinella sp. W8]|uniref:sulfotransferase family protein n=1 Tax=Lewinella sp. W8 TaxID=2528208 RepID=UPI0012B67A3F|nr:sulfotransferase [Lewinella sp. W8]
MIENNDTIPLFLGGAPKCGTSSLFAALADHPEITGSEPKETFYFLDAGHPLLAREGNVHAAGPLGHQRYFSPRGKTSFLLDGTTHLLFQQHMPEVLAEAFPSARFLFILRNPIERLRSSFAYTENNLGRLLKPISFAEFVGRALRGEVAELEKMLAPGASRYVLPRDLSYGRYDHYLANWYDHFPREQIKLVTYEAYREDSVAVVKDIIHWLQLEDSLPQKEVPRRNRTVTIRARSLHRWVTKLSTLVPAGAVKRRLKSAYLALQAAPPTEYPLPEELREQLRTYYSPTVTALREMYGLQTNWS